MDGVVVRLSASEGDAAGLRALRLEVFVEEQGVPADEELDRYDAAAVHAVAVQSGGVVVGTGRLVLVSALEARVGRMAVKATVRRQGVGAALLRFLEAEARSRGIARIVLHAQAHARTFYDKHGYAAEGGPFTEAGIEHVSMAKTLR